MIDMETLLRNALIEDATRAPELPDRWEGSGAIVGPSRGGGAPVRRARPAAWIAAAAVMLIALVIANRAGDQTRHPAWQPPGIELPLIDLGRSSDRPPEIGPVVEGLTHRLEVEGHTPIDVYPQLTYSGQEAAVERRCADDGGVFGCDTQITTSVFSTKPYDKLWIWLAVPDGTSVVAYLDGAQTRWQHPIANVAMFPDAAGDARIVVAYDENGNELGRPVSATDATQPPARMRLADISRDQLRALMDDTQESLRTCLVDLGGTDVGNLLRFDDDTNGEAAWRTCVRAVQASLKQRLVEMNVHFFDASTQAPSAPDSPYITVRTQETQPGG